MPQPFAFTLCADDYAIAPGVSRGIREAVEAGAVTATSVMTTSDWWQQEAAPLARLADRCDIGLHLNLTAGRPLGSMPRLAPDGTLPSIGTLLKLGRGNRLPLREIAEEIDRQMERFHAVAGRAPDHVDGHQHVQALPAIRPLIFEALSRRRWRPYLASRQRRHVRGVSSARGTTLEKGARPCLRSDASSRTPSAVRQAGYAINDGFAGFSSDFGARQDVRRSSSAALSQERLGARHLVMCHPGYVDERATISLIP